MRTGAEYREALRDGRKVWVMGEGWATDVTTHPATRAMVDEYALWYDRHLDPAWQDTLLSPYMAREKRVPWAYVAPKKAEDLIGMGRSFARTIFLSAGNITHTPAYGNLIALGVLTAAQAGDAPPEQIGAAVGLSRRHRPHRAFSDLLRRRPDHRAAHAPGSGRAGGVEAGARDRCWNRDFGPARHAYEPSLCRGCLCRRTLADGGRRPSGELYRAGQRPRRHGAVPQDAPPATTTRSCPRFPAASTSSTARCGSTTCSIPWDRVFFVDPSPEAIARWLRWHHLYGWLAKAEFTLGLALALTHAMGLKEHEQTIDYLIDLVVTVQTVRSSLTAAERDPEFTPAGYCFPSHAHLAAGGIQLMRARSRMSEILRIVPGSSLVVTPSDRDLAAPEVAAGLEESFGGGGYTALQRAALLQMAWDHVSSALDGREAAFEAHASGGMPNWRGWLRRSFRDYNALANAVLGVLDLPMPEIDLDNIRAAPIAARRVTSPPTGAKG